MIVGLFPDTEPDFEPDEVPSIRKSLLFYRVMALSLIHI